MGIKAQVSIAHKLGFTSHPDAVPLLRELILHNESEETFQESDAASADRASRARR
ncbi:Uncharacterised protein [Raoultella terrigena]|uniref:Uncharacterized protein n=1 Tax=Raoultella terrigena TaxID=577 RepID=A0A3P8M1U7_RAOTE|nr:Uncharacterised protein [Raoultella terrigena]